MKLFCKILTYVALIFSMLFVGVGYANLTKELKMEIAFAPSITKKVVLSSVEVTQEINSTIVSRTHSGTTFNMLAQFNESSTISLVLKFFNGSDLIYEYDSEEIHTYSNNNVSYIVNGLSKGQKLQPKSFITAYLYFQSNVVTDLTAIMNFHFHVANIEDNIGIENHESLIDAMVNDTTNGLNNPNSYLSEQIIVRYSDSNGKPSRDSLGSMAAKQGNELDIMFGDAYSTTEEISYLFHFIDPNNDGVIDSYYLYTTSIYLGDKKSLSVPLGEPVYCIYRTEIVYNVEEGKWEPLEIVEGYAPSAYYVEDQPNMNSSRLPAFDHRNWQEGRLGTSFEDAMWTNVNQEKLTCCHAYDTVEKRYYKVNIPGGTYSFVVDSDIQTNAEDVTIEVYNSNRTLISSSKGTANITNNGSESMYYIVLSGAKTMDYKFVEL